MDLRERSALNRASFCLITALLCPVLLVIGACGVAPPLSADETSVTPQAEPSPVDSTAPPPTSQAPEPPTDPPPTSREPEPPPAPPPRPQAPGSPLRVPLPTDELRGRPLSEAEAEMKGRIADACGGSQCINLKIEPQGSLDPAGRSGCVTYVVSVPGTVAEEVDEGTSIPVLYVPRGGTITLVVDLSCDESVVTESPGRASPAEPPATPEVDENEPTDPGPDPSTSSVPSKP